MADESQQPRSDAQSDSDDECDEPAADGACCIQNADGLIYCVLVSADDCQGQNGYFYGNGTTCQDPFVECEPLSLEGACCYTDADTGVLNCNEMIEDWCLTMSGTWYGPGTLCTDPIVECEPQIDTGACCYEEEEPEGEKMCQNCFSCRNSSN